MGFQILEAIIPGVCHTAFFTTSILEIHPETLPKIIPVIIDSISSTVQAICISSSTIQRPCISTQIPHLQCTV